jgi:hypothetical protein
MNMRVYAGFALHVLVASVIIFSAVIKLLGHSTLPERYAQYVLPLAIVELVNALLLLIPRTMSLGLLITSAGWGAVIATTLVEASAQIARMHPLLPTAFLMVTWIGGYLRDSRMLYSFSPAKHASAVARPPSPGGGDIL